MVVTLYRRSKCADTLKKAVEINERRRLIRKLMLNEFELDHNTTETTKNIYYVDGEGAVDQSTVTSLFKKFR